MQRIVTRQGGTFAGLRGYRYSELWLQLEAVFDVRDEAALGLTPGALTRDDDLVLPRLIARTARDLGAEAILVPSASLVGDNAILFLDLLRPDSVIEVTRSLEPNLGGASTPAP